MGTEGPGGGELCISADTSGNWRTGYIFLKEIDVLVDIDHQEKVKNVSNVFSVFSVLRRLESVLSPSSIRLKVYVAMVQYVRRRLGTSSGILRRPWASFGIFRLTLGQGQLHYALRLPSDKKHFFLMK
jgi:hypothetical protein